jgi:adenylate cyclase
MQEEALPSERVERRLAAILAADVAGYSRLMSADEEGTLAQLKAHQQALIYPKIAQHVGRIVKTTGDGMLVEFASVVDAVRCAIEIARGMIERNAEVPPEKQINFRAGVNLGDIIVDGDDIFGDGVNVAARLESLAEPGGILLSRSAHEQVQGKLDATFIDAGDKKLKNITHPVRVFRWQSVSVPLAVPIAKGFAISIFLSAAALALILIGGLAAWYFRADIGMTPIAYFVPPAPVDPSKHAPEHLSFMVMPFTNLSGDPNQDYLADVLTEELTTALSRLRGSLVIARSTALTYKGRSIDIKQIGKELGVRYILEGSTRRNRERVRVTAQLIDTETGTYIWVNQLEKYRGDLLQIREELVVGLSRALQIELTPNEATPAGQKQPVPGSTPRTSPDLQAIVTTVQTKLKKFRHTLFSNKP